MSTLWKALILVVMGLFLYSRFLGGTLLFYINERFVWLTILASLAFILVGISYRYRSENSHDHHAHGQLSWGGLALIILPVVLGLLIPPKPLGAAAMVNRDVSAKSLTSATAPQNGEVLAKPKGEKNILDWLIEFRTTSDPAAFSGQEARVVGFVYRDDRFNGEIFMVSRFVLSCCAADAAPLGLLVRWPESAALADDQWVEVTGHFEPGQFDGEPMPVLVAEKVTSTTVPEQPYLYPY